jgi:ribonuclease P protein component
MALDALEHGGGATRCGFVVSKRIGTAVTRNRVKRRLREAARAMLPRLRPGWDLAFRARPAAAGAALVELRAAMEELTLRAGALSAE